MFDHAASRLGQLAFQVGQRACQLPPAVVRHDDLLRPQIAHQVHHEQRTAFGFRVHASRERGREVVMGELEVEEFRDVLGCQQLERQLLTHSLALEVEL